TRTPARPRRTRPRSLSTSSRKSRAPSAMPRARSTPSWRWRAMSTWTLSRPLSTTST
ncbi:hypothetical protein BN1723_020256, partial [Verticillium longisporum]